MQHLQRTYDIMDMEREGYDYQHNEENHEEAGEHYS